MVDEANVSLNDKSTKLSGVQNELDAKSLEIELINKSNTEIVKQIQQ